MLEDYTARGGVIKEVFGFEAFFFVYIELSKSIYQNLFPYINYIFYKQSCFETLNFPNCPF